MKKQFSGEENIEVEVETSLREVEEDGIRADAQGEVGAKFTKEQILNSIKYANSKDMLTALLTEGESYTHSEVSKITKEFMKGEIK